MTPVELDSMISSAIEEPIAKQLGWIQDSKAIESLISSIGRSTSASVGSRSNLNDVSSRRNETLAMLAMSRAHNTTVSLGIILDPEPYTTRSLGSRS
jgi:hypothetical protein